jgi:hypothetical protein
LLKLPLVNINSFYQYLKSNKHNNHSFECIQGVYVFDGLFCNTTYLACYLVIRKESKWHRHAHLYLVDISTFTTLHTVYLGEDTCNKDYFPVYIRNSLIPGYYGREITIVIKDSYKTFWVNKTSDDSFELGKFYCDD